MKTLSIEKFFPPSLELTKKITDRMREQSLTDLQLALGSGSGLEANHSSTHDMWTDLLTAEDQSDSTTSAQELVEDQRWLSEILYGYLARLAFSRPLAENQSLDAVEAIPAGMASRLGLNDASDTELLQQLAKEFQQWLRQCSGMTFVAGWGRVWADPAHESRFGVEKFSTPPVEAVTEEVAKPAKASSATAGSHLLELKTLSTRKGSQALARPINWVANRLSLNEKAGE